MKVQKAVIATDAMWKTTQQYGGYILNNVSEIPHGH